MDITYQSIRLLLSSGMVFNPTYYRANLMVAYQKNETKGGNTSMPIAKSKVARNMSKFDKKYFILAISMLTGTIIAGITCCFLFAKPQHQALKDSYTAYQKTKVEHKQDKVNSAFEVLNARKTIELKR